ncbi:zinc ribbon domain-containing protein [Micromonospora pattaloongensis]|nr:zinc ribbon domain-containing protein [Micromonospora pattaloongensis]
MVTAQPRGSRSDPYFLRGLLYCGERRLVPVYSARSARYYACPNLRCRRLLVLAEEIEQLVWGRYVQLNADAADTVSRDRRRDALLTVLQGVRIGASLNDLDFSWRD